MCLYTDALSSKLQQASKIVSVRGMKGGWKPRKAASLIKLLVLEFVKPQSIEGKNI